LVGGFAMLCDQIFGGLPDVHSRQLLHFFISNFA
jgi:hypothetical protein